jgi:hypothetical protein
MCIGGGGLIGAADGGKVVKDLLNPQLPQVKIPERVQAPEKSTRTVRQRLSLDPSVTKRPTGGLDLFTIELSDLLPK